MTADATRRVLLDECTRIGFAAAWAGDFVVQHRAGRLARDIESATHAQVMDAASHWRQLVVALVAALDTANVLPC